jgi:hypothetical protein
MSGVKTNAVKSAKKAGIALSEIGSGAQMNWFYGDMVREEGYAVTNVAIGATKKQNKCFEITVEDREQAVKIMPVQALQFGIASVEGDDVVITATNIVARNNGGVITLESVE